MEYKININPMNCSCSKTLTNIITFYESEYNSATDRKILIKEPLLSYFKLKNVTSSPYIEPYFPNIGKGDILEIKLSALSSSISNLAIHVGQLKNNIYTVKTTRHNINVDNNGFIELNMTIPIEVSFDDEINGVFLNFRNETKNTELIIKDIEIKVLTSKELNFNYDYLYLNNKKDILQNIKNVACSDIYDFNKTRKLYEDGTINISENGEIDCSVSVSSSLKTIPFYVGNKNNSGAISVYCEYKCTSDDVFGLTPQFNGTGLWTATSLKSSSEWKKTMIYINPYTTSNLDKLFIMLGIGGNTTTSFSVRNLIIGNLNSDSNKNLLKYNSMNKILEEKSCELLLGKRFKIEKKNGTFEITEDWKKDFATLSNTTTDLKVTFKDVYTRGQYPLAFTQVVGGYGSTITTRVGNCYYNYVDIYFYDNQGNKKNIADIPDGYSINLLVIK